MDGVDHGRIVFETDGVADEERFVRDYVSDTVERLSGTAICEEVAFVRAGHDPSVDGGSVVVDVYGDPDEIVERERSTWDELVEEGPLTDWSTDSIDVPDALAEHYGEAAVDRHEHLRFVAGLMSRNAFEHLDEQPAAVDDVPESDGAPVGWHRVLHLLSNHQGYPIADELDAHAENVVQCIEILGAAEGPDVARERAEEFCDRLQDVCEGLEAESDESSDGDSASGDRPE